MQWARSKEVVELSEEAVYAATSDFYLGEELRLKDEQRAFEESWADLCRMKEASPSRKVEQASCVSPVKERNKLRRHWQRMRGSPSRDVWGDRLLCDPVIKNDCFFGE